MYQYNEQSNNSRLTTAEFAKLPLEEKVAILQTNTNNKKPTKSYYKIETNKILENSKFL